MTGPRGIVFLVGFMGSGKTSAGSALARHLGWDFVDLDELIVERARKSIVDIFRDDGEEHFRHLEMEVLTALRMRRRLVIACGGGTYAREETRHLIDAMGRAVWLRLPIEDALARCAGNRDRPLLKDEGQARVLYHSRVPSYRLAPLCVDVYGLTPEKVAESIEALL